MAARLLRATGTRSGGADEGRPAAGVRPAPTQVGYVRVHVCPVRHPPGMTIDEFRPLRATNDGRQPFRRPLKRLRSGETVRTASWPRRDPHYTKLRTRRSFLPRDRLRALYPFADHACRVRLSRMVPSYAHGGGAAPLLGVTIGEDLDGTIARFGDREALVSVYQDLASRTPNSGRRSTDSPAGYSPPESRPVSASARSLRTFPRAAPRRSVSLARRQSPMTVVWADTACGEAPMPLCAPRRTFAA
jgi:hypothetical protein